RPTLSCVTCLRSGRCVRHSHRVGPRRAALLAAAVLAAGPIASAQQPSGDGRPPPRWPDGTISFTGPPGEIGNWDGRAGATLFNNNREGALDNPLYNLPTNLAIDAVPFQPWARAL